MPCLAERAHRYPTLGTALFELPQGWKHPEQARLLDFKSPKSLPLGE